MRYASAAEFRRALETRLPALSRDGGVSLARLRRSAAFDRLLTRLFAVAPDRWVLKGGLALDYRLGAKARTTMDIDLAGPGSEDAATADLLATRQLDLGDHFSFAIERTAKLDQLVEGSAVRYQVRVELAGRLFEEFLLDVGFDLHLSGAPSHPLRVAPAVRRSRWDRRGRRQAGRSVDAEAGCPGSPASPASVGPTRTAIPT
jgi:hypothetical protein